MKSIKTKLENGSVSYSTSPPPSHSFSVFFITVFPFLLSNYITLRLAFCFLPPYSLFFFLLSLLPSYHPSTLLCFYKRFIYFFLIYFLLSLIVSFLFYV
jgi:hypothetical protein